MKRIMLAFVLVSVALPLAAQTKQARDKYESALKARDPLKAEQKLKEAIAADPTWLKPQIQLGDLYAFLKRSQDAAKTFAQIRDLDDKQKKLTEDERHHVLDSLGIAQIQTRHYEEAIETYSKAIKDDPEYPLYEYNLSCAYAEKGDLDGAIPHLKRAWELKGNMPQGQRFPDPRKDDSFRRFWNNRRFLDAVENMVV